MGVNIFSQAESFSESQRKELGLDNAPIKDIFQLIEDQGISVIKMPINDDALSGAFYYDKDTDDASILINSNRSRGHQNFTAAHEFCHFLLDKEENPIIIEADNSTKMMEKRAQAFAANFLMPKDGVLEYVRKVLNSPTKLDEVSLAKIRNEFSVSWMALIFRLKNLGYNFRVPAETLLKNTRVLNYYSLQLGYDSEVSCDTGELRLPSGYLQLAFSSYFEGKISLSRLSELLLIPFDEAREKVAEIRGMKDAGEDC